MSCGGRPPTHPTAPPPPSVCRRCCTTNRALATGTARSASQPPAATSCATPTATAPRSPPASRRPVCPSLGQTFPQSSRQLTSPERSVLLAGVEQTVDAFVGVGVGGATDAVRWCRCRAPQPTAPVPPIAAPHWERRSALRRCRAPSTSPFPSEGRRRSSCPLPASTAPARSSAATRGPCSRQWCSRYRRSSLPPTGRSASAPSPSRSSFASPATPSAPAATLSAISPSGSPSGIRRAARTMPCTMAARASCSSPLIWAGASARSRSTPRASTSCAIPSE